MNILTKIPKKAVGVNDATLNKTIETIDVLETMNECVWIGNDKHKTIYVNPIFEKTSGYTMQEALGKQCSSFFDEEGKRTIDNHHKLRKLGRSSQYEANMVSKQGKIIPLLVSGSPTKNGGTIGIFTNLTKLKRLDQQEKITRQILRYSTEAFVILDKKRHIKLWSNGAGRIFGYKEEEVLDKSINYIIPSKETETNQRLLDEVEEKGQIINVETHRLNKSGDIIDVMVSVTKVLDDKASLVGYLIIYQDITQQKRTGTELQKRFETIQDAYKELGLQRRHLDYLYEIIDSAISTGSNLENLSRLIVSALCLLTRCDGSVLRLYDKAKNTLRLKACFGVSEEWRNKDRTKFENSLAQEAYERGRPIIIDNVDLNPKYKGLKLLKRHKFKTLVLMPLYVNHDLLGCISLYATDPGKFRLIETDFLEKFSRQCALAIFVKKVTAK